MTVKFIQIVAAGVDEGFTTQCECYLFGLTAEGKVYYSDNRNNFSNWKQALPVEETP